MADPPSEHVAESAMAPGVETPTAAADAAADVAARALVGSSEKIAELSADNHSPTEHAAATADPFDCLPPYTRSLLRIKVPIRVTLAEKRQPVSRIIELGPGSIIQFTKSCDEMLDLEVGNRKVALGEAVKVGDKFGLRIVSVVLPEERFKAITARS